MYIVSCAHIIGKGVTQAKLFEQNMWRPAWEKAQALSTKATFARNTAAWEKARGARSEDATEVKKFAKP